MHPVLPGELRMYMKLFNSVYYAHNELFCTLTRFSLPAAGIFSRSRLQDTQGGRVYTTTQVWAPPGLRGACSERPKSVELALDS